MGEGARRRRERQRQESQDDPEWGSGRVPRLPPPGPGASQRELGAKVVVAPVVRLTALCARRIQSQGTSQAPRVQGGAARPVPRALGDPDRDRRHDFLRGRRAGRARGRVEGPGESSGARGGGGDGAQPARREGPTQPGVSSVGGGSGETLGPTGTGEEGFEVRDDSATLSGSKRRSPSRSASRPPVTGMGRPHVGDLPSRVRHGAPSGYALVEVGSRVTP